MYLFNAKIILKKKQLFLYVYIFKPGLLGWRPRAPGFLKLLWFTRQYACVSVFLSVCLPQRALITSGVIWCDIGCVQLVKQVSWLFPAFNYLIWHLPSIKWMGIAILTWHVVNACQRKLKWAVLATKKLLERRSASL